MVKSTSCPVTGNELGTLDLIANSLKVGEQIVLLMPSFHYYSQLQHVTTPIDFNIIDRTNLPSLSEGNPYTHTLKQIRVPRFVYILSFNQQKGLDGQSIKIVVI